MKKTYLNPEISVYKIASENVAYDLSEVFNYKASDINPGSFSIVNVDNPFAD